jgi:hypothetical protein
MVGSAFILHKNGWCCSNSANLDIYNEPVIGPSGQIESIKQMQSLMAESSFNILPEIDSECEFIFKPDEIGAVVSFKGRVRIIKPTLIINILSPIEDHKYIIDSIKNNIGI